MTKCFDTMCDLEAFGMPPDGAIVAIGLVFFDVATRTVGPKFYRAVNLCTSVSAGMKIDPATCIFWMRQSDDARLALVNNTYTLTQALTELTAFIKENCRVEDIRIWGNASGFDCSILGKAYDLCGMERPWKFYGERCFRSVRAMYPSVLYDPATQKTGVAHRADDDAEFQVRHLFQIADSRKAKS